MLKMDKNIKFLYAQLLYHLFISQVSVEENRLRRSGIHTLANNKTEFSVHVTAYSNLKRYHHVSV